MQSHTFELPKYLIAKYKYWKENSYPKNKRKYKKLVKHGQKPKIMIIACCDSRIHPTSILGEEPGIFFMHRNIANIIPTYNKKSEDSNIFSAIE